MISNNRTKSTDLQALADRIDNWTKDGELKPSAIPGLSLYRRIKSSEPTTAMYEPSICLVAQGAKRVFQGNDSFVYDTEHYLLTSVHLPTSVQVINATPEAPYLGLKLDLDLQVMAQLIADSNLPLPRSQSSNRGMAVGKATAQLITAFQRLIDLLAEPADIPILAPNIQREILYRLLVGDLGMRLRQIAIAGSQSNRISKVIEWMKSNFKKQLRIDTLAEQAGMSSSTFHHHFQSMTSLSPLQYQKQLRLSEARRLMLTEDYDAGNAAFEVGYESPSQFSREYSRLFGVPPKRDIQNMNELVSRSSIQ